MNRLRQLRRRRKISQRELAKALDVSQNSISSWENGCRLPKKAMLEKVAAYFEITPAYLLSDDVVDLSDEERELINAYRQLDDRGRGLLKAVIQYHKHIK